jgi:hypothetical protein
MATIANDTQFIGISPTIDLTGKKSAILNEQTIPVTMDDITSTVRPYNVFTALLTQSGGDGPEWYESFDNGALPNGFSVEISDYQLGDDFTNIGAPSNENGVSFIINGTTAASWTGSTRLNYNTGAPVATVLENTIGNVWFTYEADGQYYLNSDGLFIESKTTQFLNNSLYPDEGFSYISNTLNTINNIIIYTIDIGYSPSNGFLSNTPIEIRVYE